MAAFAGVEAFAAVVETGSFTAAAAALQTAKSTVSETVRALEERLGVRLLDRTTRRVRPTEAGAAFYRRCRRLLDEDAAARAELRALRDMPGGTLRVAAPEGFAQRFLVPGVPALLAEHPGLAVEIVESTGFAKLVTEELDLAVRVARDPEPGWVVRRIAASEVIVVAAPSYLARAGAPAAPQDILRHKLVGFSPLHWRDTWVIGGENIAVRPVVLSNSSESLRSAALSGVGLAAVPRWLVADLLAGGQLRAVLEGHPIPPSAIYAVFPTNRLLAPVVRRFVDHLVRELRARGLPP